MNPTSAERRQYFRLRFPEKDRPTLSWADTRLTVVELAEKGLRVRGDRIAPVGSVIAGRLEFADKTWIDVQAVVFRVDRHETIFSDLSGLSMGRMIHEQRRLLKKYAAADFLLAPQS